MLSHAWLRCGPGIVLLAACTSAGLLSPTTVRADTKSMDTTGWVTAQQGMPTMFGSAFGASTYVLVGYSGEIWTSPDGTAWTRRTNPDPNHQRLSGLTYGGGQFVAVVAFPCCGQGTVLRSPDGVNWTFQNVPQASTLYGVTYGAAQYVAVGSGGRVITSPDAITWTQRTSNTTRTLNGVTYGGGLFVAVGSSHEVITSPDGVTWTVQTPGVPAVVGTLYGVTYGGGAFVAVGTGGIMTSPNGSAWTLTRTGSFRAVTHTGSLFVGVSFDSSLPPVTSPDGTIWTDSSVNPQPGILQSFDTVSSGAAGVVGAGYSGMIFTSPDGATAWTSQTLAASRDFRGAASDGSAFCVVGGGNAVARSADGISWTNDAGVNADGYRISIARGNGLYVASGSSGVGGVGALMSSPDCITWTDRSIAPPPGFDFYYLDGIDYGGGRFVAVGEKYPTSGTPFTVPMILTSPDGIAWTEADPGLPTNEYGHLWAVGWGNGLWVAAGASYDTGAVYLVTSSDGINWTVQAPTGFDAFDSPEDVAYGNGVFVMVGGGQTAGIWSSSDAINWAPRSNADPIEVTYGANQFVAVAYDSTIHSSPDGITWSPESSSTTLALWGVTYSPGLDRFVAVGPSVIAYAGGGLPAVSIGDAAQAEGNSGTTGLVFAVTLSATYAQTVTVAYATADGTAQAGSDYTATSGTLSFAPGSTSAAVAVPIIGDTTIENDETFFVNVTSPTNAVLADAQAQGTILNDDLPALSVGDAYVVEGSTGSTTCSFNVTLSAASAQAVTVSYQTADGSATQGSDYTNSSGTLTFAPGVTATTLGVPVNPDTVVETDEDFVVNLSAPSNAVLGDAQATCLISDDDATPPSQNEAGGGSEGTYSLGAIGGIPTVNYFLIGQKPRSSYEIVVDGATADIVPLIVERLAADNMTVLQTATPIAGGSSLSLRWRNDLPISIVNQSVAIRSGGCTVTCDANDVYHFRSYETTGTLARYNNSGTQITIVVLQNGADHPVAGTLWFWNTGGTLAGTSSFNLVAHGILSLNTSTVVPGTGGTITVSNDGRYGELSGKAVAIEPATGFTFDTSLLTRSK